MENAIRMGVLSDQYILGLSEHEPNMALKSWIFRINFRASCYGSSMYTK